MNKRDVVNHTTKLVNEFLSLHQIKGKLREFVIDRCHNLEEDDIKVALDALTRVEVSVKGLEKREELKYG